MKVNQLAHAVLLALCSYSAWAAPCAAPAASAMVVEVQLANGARHETEAYKLSDKHWLVPVSALGYQAKGAKQTCDFKGQAVAVLDLASDPVQYDAANQRLTLGAGMRSVTATDIKVPAKELTFSEVVPGLRTVLDVSAFRSENVEQVGALMENSVRTQNWLFYNSLKMGTANPSNARTTTVLDTYARFEDLPARTFLQLGDAVSQPSYLGRSVRITGISWGKSATLNPAYLPYSYAAISSSSVMPSFVDVYLNQQLLRRQAVEAGPFNLALNGPLGYGEFRVVSKDALGRDQVVTQPFYNSARILEKDFLEYRVDAGGLREQYGQDNYAFDGLGGIAKLRYGASSNLTLGAQLTRTPEAASLGVNAAYRLGVLGVVSGFVEQTNKSGKVQGASFEHGTRNYSLGIDYLTASRDLAVFGTSANLATPTERLAVRASARLGSANVNLMHVRSEDQLTGKSRLNTLSLTYPLTRSLILNGNLTRGEQSGESIKSAFLNLTWLIDGKTTASAYAAQSGNESSSVASFSQLPGAENGAGFELQHIGRSQYSYVQAKGVYNNDLAHMEAVANDRGSSQLRLVTSSVWTGSTFNVGRPYADAFVLVEAPGVADALVQGPSNRTVRTNEEGSALFAGFASNVEHRLTLNVDNLPLDVSLESSTVTVTPPRLGIVKASFKLKRLAPARVTLQDDAGQLVEIGSKVSGPGMASTVVGAQGRAYFEDASKVKSFATVSNGRKCTFNVTTPADGAVVKASKCEKT